MNIANNAKFLSSSESNRKKRNLQMHIYADELIGIIGNESIEHF